LRVRAWYLLNNRLPQAQLSIPKVNMATKIMIGSHLQKMIKTTVGSSLQNMTKKMVHVGSRQQKI